MVLDGLWANHPAPVSFSNGAVFHVPRLIVFSFRQSKRRPRVTQLYEFTTSWGGLPYVAWSTRFCVDRGYTLMIGIVLKETRNHSNGKPNTKLIPNPMQKHAGIGAEQPYSKTYITKRRWGGGTFDPQP